MSRNRLALLLWIILVLSAALIAPTIQAVRAESPAAFGRETGADNACVALVLDESGSMVDNDPTYLRNTGAKLLISVLDEGDRVALVRFASNVQRLTPELVTIGGAADKTALLALLADAPGNGFTDMKAGLEAAGDLLAGATCGTRTVVLLSDGYPALEGGLPEGYGLQTIAAARQLDATLFGIALTAEGESGLLYQLTSATGGRVIPARTASDLLDAYLDVVAHLKDRTVVGNGYTGAPGSAALPLAAGLAQYVSRVTYVVSKDAAVDARLVAPGGQTVGAIDSFVSFAYTDDPRFAAYTVEHPAPGDWGWALEGNGQVQARAILRSRLRVVAEAPASYQALGEPMTIAASLIEEEVDGTVTALIGQASFSAFIIRPDGSQDELDRLFDDGTHGDNRAGDGLFTNEYVKTELPGEYTIVLTGYKGVIPATRTIRVMVVPFPQIVILEPASAGDLLELRGDPLLLSMRLEGGDPAVLDTGQFIAEVNRPNGATIEVPLAEQDDGSWFGVFAPGVDGPHTLTFRAVEATYKGAPYRLSASQTIDVRLVPAIRLTLGQSEPMVVDPAELARGVTLAIDAVSSSPQPETVQYQLTGISGLRVTAVSPEQLPPGQSTIYVTLQGELAPGDADGRLVATARPGVDLFGRELPVALRIYQPLLLVEPPALTIQIRQSRQDGQALFLVMSSQSMQDETARLSWQGAEEVRLVAELGLIPAGEEAEIPFHFAGEFAPGTYEGAILVSGRDGLALQPAIIPVVIEVMAPPWCARWCLPLVGGSVGTWLAIIAVGNRLRRRPRPHGSLQPVAVPAGQALPDLVPVVARGSRATVGSGRAAQILLPEGNVRSKHAALLVREEMIMEKVGHPPRLVEMKKPVMVLENLSDGVVQVNRLPVATGAQSAAIQPGARIRIGDYEFIYRL